MAAADTEARYCDRQYWDARYESTGSTLFDWYQDYDGGLSALLQVRVRRTLVGCSLHV
jgi:hypothetical protein